MGEDGLHDSFVFKSEEKIEVVIEMLRARAARYKQNYPNKDKVYELIYIHLSEYEPAILDIDGGMKLSQKKCLYVGK